MQDAFKAAFGHAPPLIRHVNFPNNVKIDYHLAPLLLIHLSGTQFALIASESFDGGFAGSGAAAVAYLNRDKGRWQSVRIWYEFIQRGTFGTPFIAARSVHFSTPPSFVGESLYCGAGSCTTWYALIGLYPSGPADWGLIHDGGVLDMDFNLFDGDGMTGCGGYRYSSFISAPAKKGGLMRVTYTGWMRPGGTGQKRRNFQVSTEVYLMHDKLDLQPVVTIPNCGQ